LVNNVLGKKEGMVEKTTELKQNILTIIEGQESGNDGFLLEQVQRLAQPEEEKFFFSKLLELFIHLQVDEDQAIKEWQSILQNYSTLKSALGREVGLRVAICDYFLNLNKGIENPILVEIRLFQETEKMAMVDGLTGLFNRRYFDVNLKKEMNRAVRYNKDMSIVLIDIDNFKIFNDTHGHGFGDTLLKRLGALIKELSRTEDIICRYGGEEFVMILPETSSSGALCYGERLRETMKQDEFFAEYKVTISGGVACFPYSGKTAELLLENADKSMYEAKFSGKDRIIVF